MKRKFLTSVLALALTMTSTLSVSAYSDKDSIQLESVIANNVVNKTAISAENFSLNSSSNFFKTFNNNVYVKLRDMTELYGYNIRWNNENQSIEVYDNESSLKFNVNSNIYTINQTSKNSLVSPLIYDNYCYIPFDMYSTFFENDINTYDINKYSVINNDLITLLDTLYTEQLNANEEYKKAFLETGGSIDNYNAPIFNIGYNVILSFDIISINVYRYQSLASSFNEDYYLNYDATTLDKISLNEVLGEGYESTLKNEILQLMKTRESLDPEKYSYDYESYNEIDFDDTLSFYFDEQRNLVIEFDKYEISAGVFGKQSFTLKDEPLLDESKEMYDTLKTYLSNNLSSFVSKRAEIIDNYLPNYFSEAQYDVLGLTDVEVLDLFNMPAFISIKAEDNKKVFIYSANAFDSTAYYFMFENDKVASYKIDEFNGYFSFE